MTVTFLLGSLLLAMCVLMAWGTWQQIVINYATSSAVMEASMAWFFTSGLLFAVLAGLIVVHELFQFFTGRLDEARLVGVIESEDVPHGEPQAAGAAAGK